jgi:perosamine synthetase
MAITIPVYKPALHGNEKKYVNECLDSTWISSKGKFVTQFEESFASEIDVNYASAVSNGTVALHVALVALGIGPGDEVIVPTLTYISSVNSISYTGAKPVFVDSEPEYWQMDASKIVAKITKATKAIMVVHLYGHPCDMKKIKDICDEHNLFLVEDCAEAIGTLYHNEHVGRFGDISTFSFFGNKTITTGEGGMVVTNNTTLADRVVHYKGQGLAKSREYWHDVIGYNYRMTNICAAIGLAQLENLDKVLEKKLELAGRYKEALKNTPVVFHPEASWARHSYWMCSILVADASLREPLRKYLANKGIETRPLFYPIHTMPMYANNFEKHKYAEDIGWRGINLPSFPDLTSQEIEFIADSIDKFLADANRSY